jgi:hypothetical protein
MTDTSLKDIDMLPGEVAIKAWRTQTATWGPFVSGGALNLTSERLIWVRGGLNVVPGSNVEIRLGQIVSCHADDGFSRHRVMLKLRDNSERTFHVLRGQTASEVAKTINEVLRRRGLIDD